MRAPQWIGAVLVALPVLAMLAMIYRMEGGRAVVFVFTVTAASAAAVLTGAYLLSGGAP